MLPVPKVLFPADISFFLKWFYVANFKLGEHLSLQQFRSVFFLTDSTAYDLGLDWENSHWDALKVTCQEECFPGRGRGDGERGRSWERFTQKQCAYVLEVEYMFFYPEVPVFLRKCYQGMFFKNICSENLKDRWEMEEFNLNIAQWYNSKLLIYESYPLINSIYNIRFFKLPQSNLQHRSLIICIKIT